MNFQEEIILENERVLLRPLKENDFEYLFPFVEENLNTWQYSLVSPNTEDRMKHYISTAIKKRMEKDSYAFIVFDKKENKYAGSTRFYDFKSIHLTTQLGYTWYGEKFRGTGLNKNCKYLMLEFCFEKLGLERVEFRADNNNKLSIAAMKSLGCQVEGILRSNCASETRRRDSIILSILRKEWESGVRDKLKARI